jgi:hypothetical protein
VWGVFFLAVELFVLSFSGVRCGVRSGIRGICLLHDDDEAFEIDESSCLGVIGKNSLYHRFIILLLI